MSARTVYEKTELPLDVMFAKGRAAVTHPVTCGGGFNSTDQSSDSNVVVYASPQTKESNGLRGNFRSQG